MIEVKGIGRSFGGVWALKPLEMTVNAGEFIGILGRNGAGKTTLVRILTGQLQPSEGEAWISGARIAARPLTLRQTIGVMPESGALLDGLTGHQYLCFVGQVHGIPFPLLEKRIRELEEVLEIDFHSPQSIGDYSFGMKKKVALSSSLLHTPKILFLDEPFEGLDPHACTTLRSLLESLHDHGMTIVMTSHLPAMAERLCSRFIFLDRGAIVLDRPATGIMDGEENLEKLFLRTVGGAKAGALSWM